MSRKLLLQVTAPAVLIGLATVGGCVASLWSIRRLQANLNSILAGNVTSLDAAAELEVKLRQLRFHTFLYVLDPTPARAADRRRRRGVRVRPGRAKQSSRLEDVELVADIEAGFGKYRADRPSPADLRGGWPREVALAWADAHPVRPLLDGCQELMRRNRKAMDETARESERVSERTGTAMSGAGHPWPGRRAGGRLRHRPRPEPVDRPAAGPRPGRRAQLDQDVGARRVEPAAASATSTPSSTGSSARVREVVEQAQRARAGAAAGRATGGRRPARRRRRPRGPQPAHRRSRCWSRRPCAGEADADGRRPARHPRRGRPAGADRPGVPRLRPPAPPRRAAADLRAVVGAGGRPGPRPGRAAARRGATSTGPTEPVVGRRGPRPDAGASWSTCCSTPSTRCPAAGG